MSSHWIYIVCILPLLIGFSPCALEASEQCENPCIECEGICSETPRGTKCKCASDKTGDNCDICLVKPLWFDAGNGYQYKQTDEASNYREAQKQCHDQGGHLAIYGMRDPSVFAAIAQRFHSAFVGMTDEGLEGTFLWNDAVYTSQTWTPWGENSVNSLDYDCGYLEDFSGLFQLSVVSCSSVFYGLCEVPIGCPPRIPKYNPKNNCEYFIIPPSSRQISHRLCQEHEGNLAIEAVLRGNFLKRILHHYNTTEYFTDEYNGVYLGFEKRGNVFNSDFGDALNVPNNAAEWKPGSLDSPVYDCLIAQLNPDWLNYAWLHDMDCDVILPGLCEICEGSDYLNQRTCKSGKECSANTICIVNEGSCFEDCICIEDYVKINESDPTSACIRDKCIGYECGENASCVFDPLMNKVGCKCDKGYLPIGKESEGCFLPCQRAESPICGKNAYCVIDPETNIEECVCEEFHMPNATEIDGCVVDKCTTLEIVCGNNATCCIIENSTKTQGCICDEGYYFEEGSMTDCFAPCEEVAPTCGDNAFCTVDVLSSPPSGHCTCFAGYLTNNTACIECVLDLCESGDLVCGEHATCCIVDESTKTQGCICDEGYYFEEGSTTECFDPCKDIAPTCDENAFCVVDTDPTPPKGHCICYDGYLANSTACEECVLDVCKSGGLICGENATCCITDDATKTQGCICDEGYYFKNGSTTECFDPCVEVAPNCVENAFCVVHTDPTPPEGHCICYDGYLANSTACDSCIVDKCKNGDIVCKDHATCCITDEVTKTQGCICDEGHYFEDGSTTKCFDPCKDVINTCSSNAYCAIDTETTPPTASCVCDDGYFFATEISECVLDKCKSGDIKCGVNATCCITDEAAKTQACICDEGYYFKNQSTTECFEPCEEVTCGDYAFCVVDIKNTPPEGHCICIHGYLANSTACDGCVLDVCKSGDLICEDHATCCITDEATKTQGCICDEGYYFEEGSTTKCFDPCKDVTCGADAFCVIEADVTPAEGHCVCYDGFLPNITACDGCVLDLCKSGELICGENATCCIIDEATKTQGCICDEGYYFTAGSTTECFDPCESVTCEQNAFCVVDADETPAEGHCICYDGFLPNNTACDGCVEDLCKSGDIVCVNAECCVIDETTKTQGCVCDEGYYLKNESTTECYEPCDGVICGSNAFCVIDPVEEYPEGHCICREGYRGNDTACDGCIEEDDGGVEDCSGPCANITCGDFAFCVVDTDVTPAEGHCVCIDGYFPNSTACEGCVLDVCRSGDLVCGNHATCCMTDETTKEYGCLCNEGYYFEENSMTDCFDPCEAVTCGANAFCVIDAEEIPPEGHCTCYFDYLANSTACNGCVLDLCKTGELACINAQCCITDEATKTQGCVCNEGYYLKNDSLLECYDPCDGVVCGDNAFCVIDPEEEFPEGHCTCADGYIANSTACDGCFYPCSGSECPSDSSCMVDTTAEAPTTRCICNQGFRPDNNQGCVADSCTNGTITCGTNAFCAVTDPVHQTQNCVCRNGFGFDKVGSSACSECSQSRHVWGALSDDFIAITDANDLSESTICAWMTPNGDAVFSGVLFGYAGGVPASAQLYELSYPNSETHSLSYRGTEYIFQYPIVPNTHVCYVVSEANRFIKMYADAHLYEAAMASVSASFPILGDAFVGVGIFTSDKDFLYGFKGQVDNFRIWRRPLNDYEIFAMYNNKCTCSADFFTTLTPSYATFPGPGPVSTYPTCT